MTFHQRRILRAAAALLIAASILLGATPRRAAAASTAAGARPNIIFVLTDDMGWGDLGVFYQNSRNFATNRASPAFSTPNLDRLAGEGMQLRRHYCPAPVCAPSRASLLLGVHQGTAGLRDNQFDYPLDDNHTLATVLHQAGYATAIIGKYGLDGRATGARIAGPLVRGFDFFFGYRDHIDGHYHYPKENGRAVLDGDTDVSGQLDKCYTADLWTARAKKWIADHQATKPAQPFFLYLAYDTPHAQLQVPTQPYPAGGGLRGGMQWLGTPGHMITTASGNIDSWIHPDYAKATYDHDKNPATPEIEWPPFAKRHATIMRRIDDGVADLVQTLKDLKLDGNTLVVFTSDNGPHNEGGEGGRFVYNPTFFDSFGPMDGIKRDSWEGGVREPTFVRWPGHIAPHGVSSTPSQFQDWMPTFTELAGLPAPARSDGVSLLPTLTGAGTQRPSTIYVEYFFKGRTPNYPVFNPSHRDALRDQEQIIFLDGYKGVRCNVRAATDDFKIYDTLKDTKETSDLAGSSPYFSDLQQRMKDRVLQLRRPLASTPRPYDSALVPPVNGDAAGLAPGLDWRAFEGAYPWVPDFTAMSPIKSGSSPGFDLSGRTRNDNIGLLYTGYLDAPRDGDYTFYLATDGRAFLRLHDAALLDADFGYKSGMEVTASIRLKTGRHPLRLAYIRGAGAGAGGAPSLSLQWSGPGIEKQPIPGANLLRQSGAKSQ